MRVCQLREEDRMDVVNREVAHERTVQSSLQVQRSLSQSWEDLIIVSIFILGFKIILFFDEERNKCIFF